MLVVADSSPLIVLSATGDLDILPRLFQELLVPPEVMAELGGDNRTSAVRSFAAAPPAWLTVRSASHVTNIPSLHRGETAAICLASEMLADAILIDEKRGRIVAKARGLRPLGTVGVPRPPIGERLLQPGAPSEMRRKR